MTEEWPMGAMKSANEERRSASRSLEEQRDE
jgi:hypothetical protein